MAESKQFVKPGDPITAKRWNTLAEAAFGVSGPNRRSRRPYFVGVNEVGTDMPPNGVGVLYTAQESSVSLRVGMAQSGGDILVVSDGNAIPAGKSGPVRIIDSWMPSHVDSTGVITFGESCGVIAGSWAVSRDGSGLVAVSEAEGNKVWVVRSPGGGGNNVARVSQIIPARTSVDNAGVWVHTAGGPVTATLMVKEADHALVDGGTVDLFSWVKSPSGDPATHLDGKMFVFVEQDDAGVWWFTGQDCGDPVPYIESVPSGSIISPSGAAVVYVTD